MTISRQGAPFTLLIVVPTLNSFKYLSRLTLSLQSQTFQDWRLLFVDGPSNSDHRLWLEQFCSSEKRASWIDQLPSNHGIFGAMNQGFAAARPSDWMLFWGSDDWASSADVFTEVFSRLELASHTGVFPDLLVCRGLYVDQKTASPTRISAFQSPGLLRASAYRRALLFGSTPPHQATFFGPGARERLDSYANGFRLSADLDYFLQLSQQNGLCVQCLNVDLVHMLSGGVSAVQTKLRLLEVYRAYRRAFGLAWWFPFLMRYVRRVFSLLP